MPICGPQTIGSLGSDTQQTVATITSIYGTAGAVIGVAKLGPSSLPSWLPTAYFTPLESVVATAIVVVAVCIAVVAQTYADRCKDRQGVAECFSGIVNTIVPAFSSTADELFPYAAMHDRVDIVIGSAYFHELEHYSKNISCLQTLPQYSPILSAFYHNAQICAAGAGAVAGAVIGGVVGVLLAAAAWATLGCATIIFCLLALLIAALLALAAAIAGAVIGSQAAKAATGKSTPSTSGPNGVALKIGDIVSVRGNLYGADFLQGEAVYWWTTSTATAGSWPGSPPFSTPEADSAWSQFDPCLASPNPPIQ